MCLLVNGHAMLYSFLLIIFYSIILIFIMLYVFCIYSIVVLLGTYGQVIHIFDVDSSCNVKKAITLSGHSGSVRCLSYHAPSRYLFR